MNYRQFGNTDLRVSEIGFGAWAIGGGAMIGTTPIGWGQADDATSVAALKAAVDAGINFFDTADIYGLGHSEELIGRALAGNRNIIIATKVGNVARNDQFTTDYSREHILRACEASLKRLQREVIDYYQLHTARLPDLQQGDCLEAMQQLQREGKIRYWGISLNTFNPFPEAEYFLQHNLGSGFQLVLNMINQRAIRLLEEAAAKGYSLIARMPLQFGLLTGKFDTATQFAANDHRANRLTPDVISRAHNALEPVWALCEKYDTSMTALALSYVLSYPQVSTVIPGIRTPEHVAGNTTGLVPLQEEDRKLIESYNDTAFNDLMTLIEQKG